MTIVQESLFDYAQLDTETRIVVRQRTEEIKVLVRRSAQDIIDIGNKLIDVKARLGHGNFGEWLKAEFKWGRTAAHKFMQIAETFSNVPNSEHLSFSFETMAYLAAPSTPEEIRIEAIERAQAGEVITHKIAQGMVRTRELPPNAVPVRLQPAPAGTFVSPQPENEVTKSETRFVPAKPIDIDEYEEMADEVEEDEWDRLDTPTLTDALTERAETERTERLDSEKPSKMAVHFSSESPEHYTPKKIIEAAIEVMGGIDLDPCSNSKEAPHVEALDHYTVDDDGLSQPWFGRIYLNPPYGRVIGDWTSKLIAEYTAGNVTEAIALVPGRIDTQWWQALGKDYHACFVTGRLTFIGNEDPAPFPSTVFYLGENVAGFYEVFSAFGQIWKRLDEHWFTD